MSVVFVNLFAVVLFWGVTKVDQGCFLLVVLWNLVWDAVSNRPDDRKRY